MSVQQTYHDLCVEIDILQTRMDDLEREFKVTKRAVWTGELPSENHARMPLDKALEQFDDVCERIKRLDELLNSKLATKRQIEQKLGEFEGLDYKVAYMRDIQGMTLMEISKELKFSYDWIKRISMRAGRIKVS